MKGMACSVVAAALAAMFSVSSVSAATLIVSSDLAPKHPVEVGGIQAFMECVKKGTNGTVDFNYFPSGQISNRTNTIEALNSDLAQIGFISAGNEATRIPLQGVTMLPGIGPSAAAMTRAWRKAIDQNGAMAAELTANRIHPLLLNVLPPYQVMATTKIDTVDKFAGKKIRVAGGTLNFLVSALGAVPVEMSAGDLYIALQRSTVDGTLLSMASAKSYNLQELVKAVSRNGSFGTVSQMYAISDSAWTKISPENQKVMDDCGRKVELDLAKDLDAKEGTLMDEFAASGVETFKFDDAELAKIKIRLEHVAADYIAKMKARGLPVQEDYDTYVKAMGE